MAASARAFFISRLTDQSFKPLHPPQPPPPPPPPPAPPFSRHLIARPLLPSLSFNHRRSSSTAGIVRCLISGVDGGGVSDDFVSTRKSCFGREFSVIANMLKRIEPLDNSVISKGVSDSAKDSMKQTISTMLGLLPSDQFAVTVRVSKLPLNRLLVSSIITGYTLWNAEYRISLMRNFDISCDTLKRSNSKQQEISEVQSEDCEGEDNEGGADMCFEEILSIQNLDELSPEALKYIQQLESELSIAKNDLNALKQESMEIECDRKNSNDLLKYLRSLEPDMVTELSRPSSLEVEEIIHQLVQSILQQFFEDDTTSNSMGDSAIGNTESSKDGNDEFCDTISTSRDYLAKLLFWCMLLGHHLRGLENRVHLSCVVGLL